MLFSEKFFAEPEIRKIFFMELFKLQSRKIQLLVRARVTLEHKELSKNMRTI